MTRAEHTVTSPRELKLGDLLRCNVPLTSGRDYRVAEFVILRSYVLRDGVQYAEDTLGVMLESVDKPIRRTRVRLGSVFQDGKVRKIGWSLVTEQSPATPPPSAGTAP